MELNKIYNYDVLEGLSKLEDNSIDLIITSPPYNKAGLNGKKTGANWKKTIDYGGDVNIDCKNEDDYQEWQVKVLKECYRVLKDDGSMFYNHKNRIRTGYGEIISPYRWILKTPFRVRQEIIWDRHCSTNVHPARFIPSTELIFWLTKSPRPRFNRQEDTVHKKEVWEIGFARDKFDHPAPFPVDIPDNIIPCVAQGERIVVLDPFMGSGTVALSAVKNNCDYIGFELIQSYIDEANERITKWQTS